MDRPKTLEAYIELVNRAMIDAEELRRAIEYDEEYMGGAMGIAETLENNIKSLYASLIGGSYQHADEDLDFMEIVNTAPEVWLPFKPLLRLINQTHRQGLESE
jgi:hypothetical protein